MLDVETMRAEAAWMVPVLIALVLGAYGAVAGLVVWFANRFREDVRDRLDKQDAAQATNTSILSSIRDMLQEEANRWRDSWWAHENRITRVEDHLGIPPPMRQPPPQRRYDDQDASD